MPRPERPSTRSRPRPDISNANVEANKIGLKAKAKAYTSLLIGALCNRDVKDAVYL